MLLLNYQEKIWEKNKSRVGLTENNKDKKTKGIDSADKKSLSGQFFLSGQKGIYHQVEFCRHLDTPTF